jgi:hypothetical protein
MHVSFLSTAARFPPALKVTVLSQVSNQSMHGSCSPRILYTCSVQDELAHETALETLDLAHRWQAEVVVVVLTDLLAGARNVRFATSPQSGSQWIYVDLILYSPCPQISKCKPAVRPLVAFDRLFNFMWCFMVFLGPVEV